MPAPQPAEQFWLLTGEVPSGPFTTAQVHAELAAGRAAWQTPACPVGGSTWLPLVQTPGIGPPAVTRAAADAQPPAAPSSFVAVATPPSIDRPPAESPYIPAAAPQAAQPREDAGPVRPTAAPTDDRPSKPNGSNRFWLLVGAETTGPFRAAHIRAMLQSGELSADAKARRVGTEEWVPLTEAVGALPPRLPVGPKATPSGDAAPAEKPALRQQTVAPEAPPGGGSTAPIEVRCGCGRLVHAEKAYAGQNVRCPHCNGSVAVPAGTAAAVPEPRPTPAKPWLDAKTSQTVQTLIGAVLFFALLGWMKGCKDDMAKERNTPLRDRMQNQKAR